jgi:outer membrane protein assembly factor BamB
VLQDVRTNWTANIGKVDFPLVVSARDDRIALANSQGVVAVLEASTGKDVWRLKLDQAISAGVGSDGQQLAVVTRNNELVTLQDGKVQWRKSLPAQSFTAPLVAGARVFVLTADRSVIAFDGATGSQLWTQQRPGEPLVLKQAGVMLAVKNTLVVGLSGRMVGLDPNTGVIRWESAIATPRGTNDVERLVDLVAPFDRVGDVVYRCGGRRDRKARVFQLIEHVNHTVDHARDGVEFKGQHAQLNHPVGGDIKARGFGV